MPLNDWLRNGAREFVWDALSSRAALERTLVNNAQVLMGLEREPRFGRKIWGLLSLELWQQRFHDQRHTFKKLAEEVAVS